MNIVDGHKRKKKTDFIETLTVVGRTLKLLEGAASPLPS